MPVRALEGKAVIVTGSGSGLGKAYAHSIASHGGRVLVVDIDEATANRVADEVVASGGQAIAHQADVARWNDAEEMVNRCIAGYGAVDGLVNNAGFYAAGRLEELDEFDVRRLVEVNLLGTVHCATHAVKRMIEQGGGAIVNVASGGQMGVPTMSVYGATKGGVAALTYAWAMELKDRGIRVNAVSPLADSRMNEERDRYRVEHGMSPLGAPGIPPANNAPVVAYLLSDASRDITGQIVRIEGRQLGLCTHPGILLPLLDSDGWTFEAVAESFRTDLAQRQVPLGIVGIEQTVRPNPSRYWKKAPPVL